MLIIALMSRPRKFRCTECEPNSCYFKPKGIPLRYLEEVFIGLDELEALRLADLEGLYHQDAAEKMKISRATFGRILEGARHKIAEAIIKGKALKLEAPRSEEGGSNESMFSCSEERRR